MDCHTAAEKMSELWVDRLPSGGDRAELNAHIHSCKDCAGKAMQHRMVRDALKSLPRPTAPADLTVRLQAVAARERHRQKPAANRSVFFGGWWNRRKLHFNDILRPLAVPLATGLCSAIVLFSMLVPNFSAYRKGTPDIPTGLSTEATVKDIAPLGFSGEAVVDLTVDGNGRAVDYAIVSEHGGDKEILRRGIENSLLFTVFTPATAFGQPTAGKIRLTFRNSAIDVRG